MRRRVLLGLPAANGTVETPELATGQRPVERDFSRGLWNDLGQKQAVLSALQTARVQAQADEYSDHRRIRPHRGARRAIKDGRARQLTTLFGAAQSSRRISIPAARGSPRAKLSARWLGSRPIDASRVS